MKTFFDEEDRILRRCLRAEVGQPWEDRFSIDDFANGDCKEGQVGKRKDFDPTHAPGPMSSPLTRTERRAKLQAVADKIIQYAHDHPEAMLDDNASNVNKLLDLFARMDERDEERTVQPVTQLTEDQLRRLSLADLKRGVIETVLQFVPEERRVEALRLFGGRG